MLSYNRPPRQPTQVPDFVRSLPALGADTVALFDADGTLWRNDVADDFAQWMIREGHISGALWSEYLRIYRDDHPAGCRFMLRLYAGLEHAKLRHLVATWWRDHAARDWVVETLESLHHLADAGCPVWVVTGSPTDTMMPLVEFLPVERVLGMDFELDAQGRITGSLEGISCAAEGKAEKVRSLLRADQRVVFAAGNGTLDTAMMELAEQIIWSIYPNPDFLVVSEQKGWRILPRPADFVEEVKLAP